MEKPDEALRVLVITSRPLVDGAGRPISLAPVRLVRQSLEKKLRESGAPIAARFLPWAVPFKVQNALLKPYHVVHFVGHGDEDGSLLMETENGVADFVAPERFAEMLRGCEVRLALISACHSGKALKALRKAGFPNVIAVDEKFPIDARAAAIFSGLFYSALAQGQRPTQAYNRALSAVKSDGEVGDHVTIVDEVTGQVLPPCSRRFIADIADDEPLVPSDLEGGYRDLAPLPPLPRIAAEAKFTGRQALMQRAIEALLGSPFEDLERSRLVTLIGPPGIGKTALAREVALWCAERQIFPSGAVEVLLEGVKDERSLLSAFAKAMPFSPQDGETPWEALARALSGERLALLDNAEDLRLGGDGPQSPLGRLRWLLGNTRRVRFLAITLAAPQLDKKLTPEALLEKLRDDMAAALEHTKAAGLPERLKSFVASARISYERLSDRAQALLPHLAVFDRGASEPRLEALEAEGWDKAAEELRDKNLARWKEFRPPTPSFRHRWDDGYHYVLAPIRAFARTLFPQELTAYQRQVAEWAAQFAATYGPWVNAAVRKSRWEEADEDAHRTMLAAYAALLPEREKRRFEALSEEEKARVWEEKAEDAALAAMRAASPDIEGAIWWAAQMAGLLPAAGEPALAAEAAGLLVNLTRAAGDYLYLAGNPWALAQYRSWALQVARATGEKRLIAEAAHSLAHALLKLAEHEQALPLLEEALQLFRAVSDRLGEANTLKAIGDAQHFRKELDKALQSYNQALQLFQAVGSRLGEANTLKAIGDVQRFRDQYDQALQSYHQALQLFQAIGDRLGEANTLMSQAEALDALGRTEDALRNYKRALGLYAEIGDRFSLARGLSLRSWLLLRHDAVEGAFQDWGGALILALEAGPEVFKMFFIPIFAEARRVAEEKPTLAARGVAALLKFLAEQKFSEELKELAELIMATFQVVGLVAALRAGMVPEEERVEAMKRAREMAAAVDTATDGRLEMRDWVDNNLVGDSS